jgi:hypothetical protein
VKWTGFWTAYLPGGRGGLVRRSTSRRPGDGAWRPRSIGRRRCPRVFSWHHLRPASGATGEVAPAFGELVEVSWSMLLPPTAARVPMTETSLASRVGSGWPAAPASGSARARPDRPPGRAVSSRPRGARRWMARRRPRCAGAVGRGSGVPPRSRTRRASTTEVPCSFDQQEKARWSRPMLTCRDAPGSGVTLVSPVCSRTGRPTEALTSRR